MATRMQQRRGTAAQWTAADPVLAAGEFGFESDSSKFKVGDGVNAWSLLDYFINEAAITVDIGGAISDSEKGVANGVASLDSSGKIPVAQLGNLIAGAPAALDTLNEIATALSNDSGFATTMVNALAAKASTAALTSHTGASTSVHGIADTAALATKTYADSAATTAKSEAIAALATHEADTTNIHGIADTSALATKTYADNAVSVASGTLTTQITTLSSNVASDLSTAITNHNDDTTAVHGIANTALLATTANVTTAVNNHSAATTSVHGIADTSALALTATVNSGLELKANLASPTFTGTVSGITKSMVGLGSVDNTADADKPVSSATTTALGLKANLASPTFTGTVTIPAGASISGFAPLASPALTGTPTAPTATAGTNNTQVATTAYADAAVAALVASAPAALNTLVELATALGNDASFSTTVTNSIATKAPLASPTFTGTVTIPAGASISGFAPLASPTFTGTVTVAASGVAFTDGTQTKEGVPSRTPIVQKTAAYTLSALTERDNLIEVSSASGVTITVPTNASVAYPVGTSIDILQTSTGQVTVAGASGVTINATPGLKLRTQWSSATLFKRATDTWVLMGDLTA